MTSYLVPDDTLGGALNEAVLETFSPEMAKALLDLDPEWLNKLRLEFARQVQRRNLTEPKHL